MCVPILTALPSERGARDFRRPTWKIKCAPFSGTLSPSWSSLSQYHTANCCGILTLPAFGSPYLLAQRGGNFDRVATDMVLNRLALYPAGM